MSHTNSLDALTFEAVAIFNLETWTTESSFDNDRPIPPKITELFESLIVEPDPLIIVDPDDVPNIELLEPPNIELPCTKVPFDVCLIRLSFPPKIVDDGEQTIQLLLPPIIEE